MSLSYNTHVNQRSSSFFVSNQQNGMQTSQRPSSSMFPIMHDTATYSCNTSDMLYGLGNLTFDKITVLHNLQHVPIVTLQYFKKTILPELSPTINIYSIRSFVFASSVLGLTKTSWKSFPTKPSNDCRREGEVFDGLSEIFKIIIHEGQKITWTSPILDLIAKPLGVLALARQLLFLWCLHDLRREEKCRWNKGCLGQHSYVIRVPEMLWQKGACWHKWHLHLLEANLKLTSCRMTKN